MGFEFGQKIINEMNDRVKREVRLREGHDQASDVPYMIVGPYDDAQLTIEHGIGFPVDAAPSEEELHDRIAAMKAALMDEKRNPALKEVIIYKDGTDLCPGARSLDNDDPKWPARIRQIAAFTPKDAATAPVPNKSEACVTQKAAMG